MPCLYNSFLVTFPFVNIPIAPARVLLENSSLARANGYDDNLVNGCRGYFKCKTLSFRFP